MVSGESIVSVLVLLLMAISKISVWAESLGWEVATDQKVPSSLVGILSSDEVGSSLDISLSAEGKV